MDKKLKEKRNIYFLTYGDENYKVSSKRLVREARRFGCFREIYSCNKKDLDQQFKLQFKDVLNQRRGAGYWIWKPYLINKYLKRINKGDILVYLDAGCSINKKGFNRFCEYIKMLDNSDQGIISFDLTHPENLYTNKACFKYFKYKNRDRNKGQLLAGILIMKKNDLICKQINLWLKTVYENVNLFTDKLTNNENKNFKFHRHDQSVFSLIRKQFNPLIIKDETFFEDFNSDKARKYPFHATRIGDSKKLLLKYLLRII